MESYREKIAEAIKSETGEEVARHEIEIPDAEHGDFAYPAMKLASALGKDPREVASDISEALQDLEFITKTEVAGPGYVNFFVNREEYSKEILDSAGKQNNKEKEEKLIIEHTSPNPNKPLHMGTMRTAILGDSIARIADYQGFEVEVQNLINDLGRQIARTVYAYRNFYEELSEEDRKEKADFWIGRLYSMAGSYIEENPEEEEKVDEIIRQTEEMDNETAELKDELMDKSVKAQLKTSYRSNIFYDVVTFERDLIKSDLLEETLEKLEDLERVHEVEDGDDEGCLVMEISDFEGMGNMKKPYKILKRSDGTATYNLKDIALTLWKFGKLESNFRYKEFDKQTKNEMLYSTGGELEKEFGNGDRIINVVGAPQAFPMKILKHSLEALGYNEEASKFSHMDFKFVYLPGKVAYSGRKGNWVGKHGDAVLERSKELAFEEVDERYEYDRKKKEEMAEKIAVAAVRYFVLKFTREKDIDFSFEKALDWQGDSGPYLMYSVARAYGIQENSDTKPEFSTYSKDVEYELIRKLSEFEEKVKESFESQEPAKMCHYLKSVAEKFNSFYHSCPVGDAETQKLAESRIAVVESYIDVMETGMDMIGIESLEEM